MKADNHLELRKKEEWDKLLNLLILEMSNLLILTIDIHKQLKVMLLLTEYTNFINLIRAKVKWCPNLRSRDKVNRLKKVVKGNILIQLKLLKDQWVIKVEMRKKSRDPLRQKCFRSIREVNQHKIKQCNKIVKLNKGLRYKISEIVSKTWILIVTSIKCLLKNQLLIKIKVFRGLLLRQRNLKLDLVSLLNLIRLNRIKLLPSS